MSTESTINPTTESSEAETHAQVIDAATMNSISLIIRNPDLYPELFEALSPELKKFVIAKIGRAPKGWNAAKEQFETKQIGPVGNKKTRIEWRKTILDEFKKRPANLKKAFAD